MKYLEELRDIHEGEEIWAIGGGPSLDDYPIDFFENKICIGVNWVFSVFVDIGDGIEKFDTRAFYSVHSHAEHADWIAKHRPQFLKNCFFLHHLQRRIRGRPYCRPEDFNDDPYWVRCSGNIAAIRASDATFRTMAKCIAEKGDNCSYFCRGTTLHWAIAVAAVLGAKKIYVVGGEAKMSGDARHMYKHGSIYSTYTPRRHGFISSWASGTKSLAVVFRPHGVKIVYYYYGKGEIDP